jgi:hypothetical protein
MAPDICSQGAPNLKFASSEERFHFILVSQNISTAHQEQVGGLDLISSNPFGFVQVCLQLAEQSIQVYTAQFLMVISLLTHCKVNSGNIPHWSSYFL